MSLSSMRGFARECTSMATEQFPNSRLLTREPSAPSLKTTPVSRQPWMVLRVTVGEVCAPLTRIAEPAMFERSHCSMRQLPCVTSIKAGARSPLARDEKVPMELSRNRSEAASRHMVRLASLTPPRSSKCASGARRRTVMDLPPPMISTAWSTCRLCCTVCSPVNSLTPKAGMRLPGGARPPLGREPPLLPWLSSAARLEPMYKASASVAASRGTTISQQTSSRKRVPSVSGFVSGSSRESTPESRISFRRL
mmetsp:Transcript_19314/g.61335  ORF Transcript_19314/g.61335 Transcript_19314/m.61335 type:complete len:252 (+) Transcript_19314:1172-1927(+)